jgi:hypothetical protein
MLTKRRGFEGDMPTSSFPSSSSSKPKVQEEEKEKKKGSESLGKLMSILKQASPSPPPPTSSSSSSSQRSLLALLSKKSIVEEEVIESDPLPQDEKEEPVDVKEDEISNLIHNVSEMIKEETGPSTTEEPLKISPVKIPVSSDPKRRRVSVKKASPPAPPKPTITPILEDDGDGI